MTTHLPTGEDLDLREIPASERPNLKKHLLTLAKILFSGGTLWLVFSKMDKDQFVHMLQTAHLGYIFAASLLLNLGQIFSSLRSKYYFKSIGIDFATPLAIRLNYIGMLFNMVLPGGIGGDGYKAWYMKKHYQLPWKAGVRSMLSNRANGLLLLLLITYALAIFSEHIQSFPYANWLLLGATFTTLICYSAASHVILKEPIRVQLGASVYSLCVQTISLCVALLLLYAIDQTNDMLNYLILFMLACIVSVLPVSVGGVGLREMTFLYGAQYAGLSVETGVSLSVLFFLINLLASLFGLIYFFKRRA